MYEHRHKNASTDKEVWRLAVNKYKMYEMKDRELSLLLVLLDLLKLHNC